MKRAIFVILMVMLLMAGVAEAQPPTKTVKIRLNTGSTSSASGAYIWSVAVARAINKYAPGINVTVIESGGTVDNVRKIKEGIFDCGLADSWSTALEMYRGLENFAGNAWEPIRVFFVKEVSVSRTYVRADSGIKTWSDLQGKKIGSGQPGSGAAQRVMRFNELLGTGAIVVPVPLGDALRDLQSGRIDAVHKSGPADDVDAALLEVHLLRPVTVLGFSEQEAAKINAKYPQYLIAETSAGAIKTLNKLGRLWEVYLISIASVSSRMPEDVGYRMMKAVHEHWSEIAQAFPSSGLYHPIKEYVKLVPKGMEVPFQAGVVRYAKEIGITIPASLIPPEYKQR